MGDYGYSNGYSTTSYGAHGGANDGGFMAGGSQENKGPKGFDEETLRPVTIKQINEADTVDGDSFKIDASPIAHVTLVGQIRNVSAQTTMQTYRIDDGTGVVEVKQWTDPDAAGADDEGSSKPALVEGVYARVFGQIKSFNNKRYVTARPGGLRAITDHNEVQTHLLEATVVHLQITRGPPGQQRTNEGRTNGQAGSTMNGAGSGGGKTLPAGLSPMARNVYGVLQANETGETNEGLHVHDIAARLGAEPSAVEGAGAELVNMGLTYSTVDEQTWAIMQEF